MAKKLISGITSVILVLIHGLFVGSVSCLDGECAGKDAGEDGCYTIKDVLMWNPTVMLANGDEGHGVDWLLRTEAVE